MNREITAITLFCEDIREEKSGTDSLIGVLMDNLEVPSVPGALAKLGMYTRMGIPPTYPVAPIRLVLKFPDGTEQEITEFKEEIVRKAIDEAKASDAPFAGLVSRALATPFPIAISGRFVMVARTGNVELVSGHLNVKVAQS